jgi:hypothetical protein
MIRSLQNPDLDGQMILQAKPLPSKTLLSILKLIASQATALREPHLEGAEAWLSDGVVKAPRELMVGGADGASPEEWPRFNANST